MKGTIEIKIDGIDNISVYVKMSRLHRFEKLILMDSLAEALKLGEEERVVIGMTVAAGGVSAVLGAEVDKTVIDVSALKKQVEKNKGNETDSK